MNNKDLDKRWKMNTEVLSLLQALMQAEEALACHRDGVPYKNPAYGELPMTLEEVLYCIIQPAIQKAVEEL